MHGHSVQCAELKAVLIALANTPHDEAGYIFTAFCVVVNGLAVLSARRAERRPFSWALQTVEANRSANQTAWVIHRDAHGKDPSLVGPTGIRLSIQSALAIRLPPLPGSILVPNMVTHPPLWTEQSEGLYVSDEEAIATYQLRDASQKLDCSVCLTVKRPHCMGQCSCLLWDD